jgi:Asp/Glu/hydantoin racemase
MSTIQAIRRNTKILVLNPNSSRDMTHTLEEAIRNMELFQVQSNSNSLVHVTSNEHSRPKSTPTQHLKAVLRASTMEKVLMPVSALLSKTSRKHSFSGSTTPCLSPASVHILSWPG